MVKYSGVAFSYENEVTATELEFDFVEDVPTLFFISKPKTFPGHMGDMIIVYPKFEDADNTRIIFVSNYSVCLRFEIDTLEDIMEILLRNTEDLPYDRQRGVIIDFVEAVGTWFKKKGSELSRIHELMKFLEEGGETE